MFTLSFIAVFIAGSAFMAWQDVRAATGSLAGRLALEAAEYGATAVLRDWDASWNTTAPVGRTLGPFTHAQPNGAAAAVRVTRASTSTWWVMSDGTAGGTDPRRSARRTVHTLLRLDLVPEPGVAAFAAADSARVTGAVIGTDSVEAAGICAGLPALATAGVATADTASVVGSGAIVGTPPLLADSSIPALVTATGASLVPDLTLPAGAVVTPGPALSAGACDTLVATNWGDPGGGPCGVRRPVIVALGDVTMRGGTGQGILYAAGDVTFEAGAFFAGLVVAGDDFLTGSGGGIVLGAVLAGDARRGAGDHSQVGAGGVVRRASCQVRLARLAAAAPIRVRDRWWAGF